MKLITLNTWGGKIERPFEKFVKKYSKDIDIFCFQEVFDNYKSDYGDIFAVKGANPKLHGDLVKLLKNHTGYFQPVFKGLYGISTFVSKKHKVLKKGSRLIYENKNFPDKDNPDADHDRELQWLVIKNQDNKECLVMNLHGHWVPGDKSDNEARIKQSKKIVDLMADFDSPKILCGDFNLNPDTKSIAMLDNSLKNLIKTYNIKSTRTSLYKKTNKFADYVFVSSEINVRDFKCLPEEVSDHKALFLEFS